MHEAAASVADVHESVRSRGGRRRHPGRGFVDAEVRDDVRGELLDERGEPVAVARVDSPELGAAQPPAGRNEVDADDVGRPLARLDQLRDAGTELTAHSGNEHSGGHDFSASGRRCGKRITSRMEVTPASTITRRSTPRPIPPVGGRPYSSART